MALRRQAVLAESIRVRVEQKRHTRRFCIAMLTSDMVGTNTRKQISRVASFLTGPGPVAQKQIVLVSSKSSYAFPRRATTVFSPKHCAAGGRLWGAGLRPAAH